MEVPKSYHLFWYLHQHCSLLLPLIVETSATQSMKLFLASCIIMYIEARILEYVLKISNTI